MTCTGGAGLCTQLTFDTASNRINLGGYSYDAAGNLLTDPSTVPVSNYTWDAEGRVATITQGGSTYSNNTYNADGQLVEAAYPGFNAKVEGIFDPVGGELGYYDGVNNAWFDQDIWAAGRRVAQLTPTDTYFLHSNHLHSNVQVTDHSGAVKLDLLYYPWGQIWQKSGSLVDAHFAGFQRGAGNVNVTPTRRYSNVEGRFLSPDPLGGSLMDPQSLNRYAYVLNNPLTNTDPTGLYVCKDSAKCDSDADKAFEKARQADLKSKDANVVRGASAYGGPTKDNGVNVAFGDPGKGNDGITSHGLGVGPDGKLRAEESVTIRAGLSGSGLDAVIGHEGSHVADAQDFASTMTMGGNFDVSKNLSKYQTEFKAYMVSNSIMNSQGDKASYGQGCDGGPCILGFGVGQRQAGNTINQLLANPANGYGVTPKAPGALLYPTLTVPQVPK